MRKVPIFLALGYGFLCVSSALAKDEGLRHEGFVFPSGLGCFCPGFFVGGTHLGFGPGYPGLQPPFSILDHCGFYPGRYRLPLRIPTVTVYTIRPSSRIIAERRHIPSPPVARDDSQSRASSAEAEVGRDFRMTVPALNNSAKNDAQFNNYIPKRCYRRECHIIKPEEALSSDRPPGIIIWEPR
jgi:hypothetical protein